MEICGEIKSLERCIAGSDRINDHQKSGFGNVNEKVAFGRMIAMARELDSFAAKLDRLLGLECYGWHQPIRVVRFLQEVADAFERDDLEIFDVLKCCGSADMILVRMRVDQHLDRLVSHFGNFQRNALSEACRRIKNDDSFIGYQECGLPPVVRHDVNAATNVFDRIAKLWIDLPKLRLHCRKNRNIIFQGLWRRLSRDLPAPDGSEHQCKYELFHFSSPCD